MLDLAWRPRAQLDRESIAIYLGLERGMPQAALDAIKGIDAALETVRTFPDAGGHFTDDACGPLHHLLPLQCHYAYGVPHHASAPIHRHLQPD